MAEPSFLVGGLLGLGADALVELVLQVGVALHQGHAVDAGLGERDEGKGAVGGDGLAREEAVGGADAGSRVLVLLIHARDPFLRLPRAARLARKGPKVDLHQWARF